MKISVLGLGYVGSVCTACLAKCGHQMIGVDINESKVNLVNAGRSPVIEKGLEALITESHKLGRIEATCDTLAAVANSDASFICVGTPSSANGHLDMTSLLNASSQVARGLRDKSGFHLVVIRSTVPPGTNKRIAEYIAGESGKSEGLDFAVVSNPEFLREGSAIEDFFNPPFTLVGSSNSAAVDIMHQIYAEIDSPIITTQIELAELIKYVNNAFHALKISFVNEVGNICKKLGVDSHNLMDIFALDRKLNISDSYLKPGFAYGGSCLPKDLRALKAIAHDHFVPTYILDAVEKCNEKQKEIALETILSFGKEKIGFVGLAFKSGTDDLRESPIIDVIERLLGKGFRVLVYDKCVNISNLVGSNMEYMLKKIPFISKFLVSDIDKVLLESEVVVIVNNCEELLASIDRIAEKTIIYDLVNINVERMKISHNYHGICW